MAKLVSSAGLQDFIATGKPTEVIAKEPPKPLTVVPKPAEGTAPPPEAPKAAETPKEGEKEPPKVETPTEGLEPEDHDLPERARKRIGKKHYEMMKAREEAAEAERFAEIQFNERRQLEQRLAQTEAERDQLKKTVTPAPEAPKKPTVDQFKNDQGQIDAIAYAEALAAYSAQQAVEKDRQEQAEAAKAAAKQAKDAAFAERIQKAREKYPDWQETVAATPVRLQTEALTYIAESEYGADLAYYLADPKQRELADRIAAMSPFKAIAELGRLETRFEKPANGAAEKTNAVPPPAASKTVEREGAPAPITPLPSSSATINTDPAKMSFKELRAYERERARRH
jgi:hypothetical protein